MAGRLFPPSSTVDGPLLEYWLPETIKKKRMFSFGVFTTLVPLRHAFDVLLLNEIFVQDQKIILFIKPIPSGQQIVQDLQQRSSLFIMCDS